MFLARVTGAVVATVKVPSMVGQRLYLVDPLRLDAAGSALQPTGRTFVALDLVGVGEGQVVMVVQGSSARATEESAKLPVDAAIIGLVDRVSAFGQEVFHDGDKPCNP